METITEVVEKRMSDSLIHFMKLVDPERKYKIDLELGKAWNSLTLTDQRKMYAYMLYRKWRGEGFYGTPYEMVKYCHPYPFNWNGTNWINKMIKSETRMVRAKFGGGYGIYTLDEARLYQMTEIVALNYTPHSARAYILPDPCLNPA